jgi:TolB-like protein
VPFEDLNPSTTDDYFSMGITDEITQALADHNLFQVIRHEKPVQYSEEAVLLSSRNDGSAPDYELRGQAGIFDDIIRIRISLKRLSDGKVIFNKSYENELAELSLVQENISSGIFKELVSELESKGYTASVGSVSGIAGTSDESSEHIQIIQSLEDETDIWRLYFKGRHYWRISTKEFNEIAIEIFHRAGEIDPNFAHAYIGLADCYLNYVNFNWDNNLSWIMNAEDMLAQAFSINPDLPEYYSISAKIKLIRELGFGEDTLEEAFRLADAGLAKYPNHVELTSTKGYCFFVRYGKKGQEKDFVEALKFKEKAFWMNPYTIHNINYAELLMLNREFDKAVDVCQNIIPFDATHMAKFMLGQIYYYKGALDDCDDIFLSFKDTLEFRAASSAFLGMTAAQRGESQKALRLAERVKKFTAGPYGNGMKLASIYSGLGNEENARVHLENFFGSESPRILKFVEKRYMDLDVNFAGSQFETGKLF